MALPQLPPPVDINNETKRAIIEGLKKVIETFQANDVLDKAITYQDVIHDPGVLYGFIQTFRKNPRLADAVVVGKNGKPVTSEDAPLVCNVSLAQILQLLVKTCGRYFLEQDTKTEEEIVTQTVTTKRFLIFKKTEQVERKTGGGHDERKVREVTRYMAFDWQLPLLPAYAELNSSILMELDQDVMALRTPETVRELVPFDQATIKKVKSIVGADFTNILANRPAALAAIATWTKDGYALYRHVLGDKAFDFFCRDKKFFMVCAALDKPLVKIYGDVLCYIASENLEEMQRLNIDRADVLIAGMRYAFGDKLPLILGRPAFAKDVLRKLVESLLHITQEKDQMLMSAQLTCKAIVPQVMDWLTKQPPAEA